MEIFETARLRLRPLTLDDLDALYDLYRRPELMQYITGAPRSVAVTEQRLHDHVADHQKYGFGLCAALDKKSGRFIGRCGVEPVVRDGRLDGNLAWLFLREFWNRGLATEFAGAMISIAFDQLHLKRVIASADRRNVASIRVMDKVDMVRVRVDARGVLYERWHDHLPAATLRTSKGDWDVA